MKNYYIALLIMVFVTVSKAELSIYVQTNNTIKQDWVNIDADEFKNLPIDIQISILIGKGTIAQLLKFIEKNGAKIDRALPMQRSLFNELLALLPKKLLQGLLDGQITVPFFIDKVKSLPNDLPKAIIGKFGGEVLRYRGQEVVRYANFFIREFSEGAFRKSIPSGFNLVERSNTYYLEPSKHQITYDIGYLVPLLP